MRGRLRFHVFYVYSMYAIITIRCWWHNVEPAKPGIFVVVVCVCVVTSEENGHAHAIMAARAVAARHTVSLNMNGIAYHENLFFMILFWLLRA